MSKFTKRKPARTKTTNDVVSALSVVAHTQKKEKRRERSRFFFRLDDPVLQIKEEEQPVNEALVKATDEVQHDLPARMVPLVDNVRSFFLNELAPLTLAGVTGAQQARKALSDALGTEVDASTEAKFRTLLSKATDIKLASYIKRYMSLSEEEAALLIDAIKPKTPANLVLPLGQPYENKHSQKTQKGAQNRTGGRRDSHRPGHKEEIDLP